MKSFVTAALLFTCASAAHAQTQNKLPVADRVKIISLSADTGKNLELPPVSVSGIRVIPICSDTSRLGFVEVGAMGKLVSGVTDKPWQQYLQDFVDAQYKSVFKDTGVQLLWIVHELRISEGMIPSRAYVQLKATVYMSAGQDQYRLLTIFDRTIAKRGGGIKNKHDDNIADILRLLFKESSAQAAGKPSDEWSPQTLAGVLATEQQRFQAPILTSPGYTHGVYTTYKQFLDNAPAIDSFKVKQNIFGKLLVYAIGADSSRLIENPWGLCMNGKIYKCQGDALVPLERYGQGFAISGYINAHNEESKDRLMDALDGIATGRVVVSPHKGVFPVTANPYITNGCPEATRMDLETGELAF
ncbi:hypothetical protein F0L74_12660 [Chitinophaga agrisoli]|uniref:Uncharacterized protein n=1 Tax=Chitinophaga agrisoli TaxID=2607653 RepID=A0A5B2VXL2_9BACT|nr:hypothetical protein [Chitinophaga agrisoli]KAA2243348.1 hypothetical protein F0L74_12660 [Chitinophaga agrisoli]